MAVIQPGGAGGSGWIKITDVSPKSPGTEVYLDPPNDTILQSATVTGLSVDLTVRSSSPLVDIEGGGTTTLTQSADGGHYSGTVPVTLTGVGVETVKLISQTPDANPGAFDSIDLSVEEPPEIIALNFAGDYPGAQTELKEDDTFDIHVEADKAFDRVEVQNFEACKSQVFVVSPAATSEDVSAPIDDEGNTAVLRPARVRVRDASTGAWSSTRDTNFGGGTTEKVHVVLCNNLHPTLVIGAVTYPPTQGALKGSESASVAVSASNYDSIGSSSPTGELIISGSPPTYTAQRVSGSYNDSVQNFELTATRNANASETVDETLVEIANVAPTVSVTEPATRLRSGGSHGSVAQDHSITVTSDQKLAAAPTLNPDSGGSRGTFIGSWAGGPKVWNRDVRVDDTDEKGTFTWEGLVATNLAGIVRNTISGNATYVLGGMVKRTVPFATPFKRQQDVGTTVATYTKVQAALYSVNGQVPVRNSTPGDTSNKPGTSEFTVVGGTDAYINDTDVVNLNGAGTLTMVDFEETV